MVCRAGDSVSAALSGQYQHKIVADAPARARMERKALRLRTPALPAASQNSTYPPGVDAMDAVTTVPGPRNEPPLHFAPGSAERASLTTRLDELGSTHVDLTMSLGTRRAMGGGDAIEVVAPHRRKLVLGTMHEATAADVSAAIDTALAAAPSWRALSFDDRAAVFLKAADLLAGPWRDTINAATMLGQSKTCYQADIDAACELADFWRFNVQFARDILAEQPLSPAGVWNRLDHRPLEGFVLAITPFNFTSIAGNLPTAPAIMGNVVVWKPSPTAQLAAHHLMALLDAAGLPPGVISMVTGNGAAVSEVALPHHDLAGIHFTGSTATFQHLWRSVGENIDGYRSYPRIVGETGGKGFRDRTFFRRRRRAQNRVGARRFRIPRAEVLGGVTGVRAPVGLAAT